MCAIYLSIFWTIWSQECGEKCCQFNGFSGFPVHCCSIPSNGVPCLHHKSWKWMIISYQWNGCNIMEASYFTIYHHIIYIYVLYDIIYMILYIYDIIYIHYIINMLLLLLYIYIYHMSYQSTIFDEWFDLQLMVNSRWPCLLNWDSNDEVPNPSFRNCTDIGHGYQL